jgi:signal transduction histidine kinase
LHDDLLTVLATLRYRLQARLEAAGIAVVWDVAELPVLPQLSPQAVLQVQRILLEAFTNVLKHARASRVTVTVRWLDGTAPMVLLRISDNGVGLAAPLPGHTAARRPGHGVGNMLARAATLGAVLRLETAQGGGCCVALDWPLAQFLRPQ